MQSETLKYSRCQQPHHGVCTHLTGACSVEYLNYICMYVRMYVGMYICTRPFLVTHRYLPRVHNFLTMQRAITGYGDNNNAQVLIIIIVRARTA